MRHVSSRYGFTLVEVLVVIAILGILISLVSVSLGPALSRVRRASCEAKMQEIGKATINFEVAHDRLPGYLQQYGEFAGGADPYDPGNFGGNVPRHIKIGSWHIALLPDLEHSPIYDHWWSDQYSIISDGSGSRTATSDGYTLVAAANLSAYQCPSASGSNANHGKNNYIANTGFHADSFPFTYTRPTGGLQTVSFQQSISQVNGALTNRYEGFDDLNPALAVAVGGAIRTSSFKDGTSNTMLYTESNQAQPWHVTRLTGNANHLTDIRTVNGKDVVVYPPESRYLQGAVFHFEDPDSFAGSSNVDDRHRINGGDVYNDRMTASNFADLARPSSLHQGGVNMVMADGSVRFVSEQIDYRILQALMTPSGKQSDVPDNRFIATEPL